MGTYMYMKKWGNFYQKVHVTNIYLEKYVNGWKPIIKTQTDSGLIYSFFMGDLNYRIFMEMPEDGELYVYKDGEE